MGDSGRATTGSVTFARIDGSIGMQAPFYYSCTEQQYTALDTWEDKPGALVIAGNLRNIVEIGVSGAAEVPDGSIVIIFQTASDDWVFNQLHYRGTYA